MSITVTGTGLGLDSKGCGIPPCAPEGLGPEELFKECRPPWAHFVAENYGHMDVLDDDSSLDMLGKFVVPFRWAVFAARPDKRRLPALYFEC
ncbi:Chlorophyllase [Corchorus capsularis]|uniref:Chlorophyllase n=1 Tax=Corchorus capsularis TaxID=210143 RepID=A0A1R3IFM7_COCAP|nr:Chlorophyllase [Corchorus capsularis]